MSRRVSAIFILNIAALALVVSCGENPVDPPADPVWIALTATIESRGQIYLVDYDDPTRYKRVTQNNHQNIHPKFSPDRAKIIFLDNSSGSEHQPMLRLYDLESESIDSFTVQYGDRIFSVLGDIPIVFSPDGSGFYFTLFSPWIGSDILYYNFSEGNTSHVRDAPGTSEWPAGIIGSDTLIAFTNETAATQGPRGFYYMDLQGNYLSYINNPHLELINRNGVNKKAAYHPDWNDDLDLFVYAEIDSTVPGYKISVTDLAGSYYRAYTSGDYIDEYPSWGPGGQSILFRRRNLNEYSGPYKVMLLDLDTGQVREFVKPSVIDGATSLHWPDY